MKRVKTDFFIENLQITDAGSEGMAVGKHENMVVFVPYAVVGDIVNVQVIKKKKSYAEAKITQLVQPSPDRVKPICSHFGVCGGCKWQHFEYSKQLIYKQKQVFDNFSRLGKFEFPELSPVLPSESIFYYRNKLEYSFSDRRWLSNEEMIDFQNGNLDARGLGYHIPGRFDKILDISECYLQAHPSNAIRLEIKKFAIEKNFTFWNAHAQEGDLRNIIIRSNQNGDFLVIIVLFHEHELYRELLEHIALKFPEIKSLYYIINPKANDSVADLTPHLFKGNPVLTETMEDLTFEIGPLSFYQTNAAQAYKLYLTAREFAHIQPEDVVYDLYTGAGTIANFVARQAKKVVGIEYVEDAVKDARKNSVLNGITNTVFFAGDMAHILTPDFVAENGKPSVIITDPPRAGMHPKVVAQILEIKPDKIVYVSCNPATQARDIDLMKLVYEVVKIQPVDMFPHTQHIENVVLLELKS